MQERRDRLDEYRADPNIKPMLESLGSIDNPLYLVHDLQLYTEGLVQNLMTVSPHNAFEGLHDDKQRHPLQQEFLNFQARFSRLLSIDIATSPDPLQRMSYYLEAARLALEEGNHVSALICYSALSPFEPALTKQLSSQDLMFYKSIQGVLGAGEPTDYTFFLREQTGDPTAPIPIAPITNHAITLMERADKGRGLEAANAIGKSFHDTFKLWRGLRAKTHDIDQQTRLVKTPEFTNLQKALAATAHMAQEDERKQSFVNDAFKRSKSKEMQTRLNPKYKTIEPKKKKKIAKQLQQLLSRAKHASTGPTPINSAPGRLESPTKRKLQDSKRGSVARILRSVRGSKRGSIFAKRASTQPETKSKTPTALKEGSVNDIFKFHKKTMVEEIGEGTKPGILLNLIESGEEFLEVMTKANPDSSERAIREAITNKPSASRICMHMIATKESQPSAEPPAPQDDDPKPSGPGGMGGPGS